MIAYRLLGSLFLMLLTIGPATVLAALPNSNGFSNLFFERRHDLKSVAAAAASQQAATVPSNVAPWCANIITLFRPFITLTLVGVATVVYFHSVGSERTPMAEQVNFAAFNAVGWWFGDRMAKKTK